MPHLLRSVSFLFALPLAAQGTIVIPPAFTNAPALATSAYPLGVTAAHRTQYIYAASETGLVVPTLLKSMEMRSYQLTANPVKTLTLQIELSTTSAQPNALSATFATNRGANHTVVFTSKPVNLPATTTGFIGQWSGPMLFDVNFNYDPTLGNLLCEFDVAVAATPAWALNVTNTAAGSTSRSERRAEHSSARAPAAGSARRSPTRRAAALPTIRPCS